MLVFPGSLGLGSDGLGIKMLRLLHGENCARKVKVCVLLVCNIYRKCRSCLTFLQGKGLIAAIIACFLKVDWLLRY